MIDTTRKSVIIHNNEDEAITFLKPFSNEYSNMLFVIHEDAYGKIDGDLMLISDLIAKLNMTIEQFDEILNQL